MNSLRRKELIPSKLIVFFTAMSLFPVGYASSAETPRRIEITVERFTYEPEVITLKRGEPVVLVMHSIDVTHGIEVDELNLKSEDIKKDKATEIRFTPEKAGHFIGKCAHFCGRGHGMMTLQIEVLP
jgi:cytochrome c oxidase subunit II